MFLSLNGTTVPNNGYVLASSIFPSGGLQCDTNRRNCCRNLDNPSGGAQGDWYFPDGTIVASYSVEEPKNNYGNFFFRKRERGTVYLSISGTPLERGRFRCEMPNANGITETRYVNIGEYFLPSCPWMYSST